MTIVTVYDMTGANIAAAPEGAQLAGYVTGTGDVPWTAADWAAHPGAIRIDQDPAASDATADVLDVEKGAATVADVVPWARAAYANRANGVRQGQRWPAIYASAANITPIANALEDAAITSGVFLWIANWNLTQEQAGTDILSAGGPWPVVGVQFRNSATYDVSLFSAEWLGDVTGAPPPTAPPKVTKAEAESALTTLTTYVTAS
jgi:hypothetical protein